MEKINWQSVFYNGNETNIEVTKCGRVRRKRVSWLKYTTTAKIGEVDLNKLKLPKHGYYVILAQIKSFKAKSICVHQLIASAFLNYKFEGVKNVVDHIDSNKLNNNYINLRIISNRENSSKEKTIKSGLPTGVYWNKRAKKYVSRIKIKGDIIHLGYYKNINDASDAYKIKLLEQKL